MLAYNKVAGTFTMDTLLRIAHKAKIRLQLNATVLHCIRWCLLASVVLFLLAVIDRVGIAPILHWNSIWIGAACAVGILFIAQWNAYSFSLVQAGAEIDLRMKLDERVSSALSVEPGTPYADVVLSDALDIVKKKQVRSSVPRFFPVLAPANSYWVVGFVLATLFVLWTPQWGMFQGEDKSGMQALISSDRENIEASIDSVLEQLQHDEELSEALEEELNDLSSLAANSKTDPEKMRRDALRKMTDMQKRLEEMLQGEDSLAFEEILRRLQGLKLPKTGDTLPMIAAMKNGNMSKAKKEFEKLQEKMDSEELSKEEREELTKQLEALGEQFEKLAKSDEALASALSAAGLNGALAKNADAAMKAIKNAENLNDAQKKKLLELLKAQQTAKKNCQNMGKGCKQCADGKDGGSAATSELEKMEAMQAFKTKAEMAKSACQTAGAGMCNKPGSGLTGGQGEGNGGVNATKETDATLVGERTPVSTLEGTIIAKQLFEGGLLTSGESTSAIKETVLAQRRDSEQAITDEEVPRRYHDLLRHYFGQLEEMTKPFQNDEFESDD